MNQRISDILSAVRSLSEEDRAELLQSLAAEYPPCPPSQGEMPLPFEAEGINGQADYIIVFDGGSHGNPGPGYGSYALIRRHDGKERIVRLEFGRDMTNNEAEYEALIAALEGLTERIEQAGRSAEDFSVEVRGDSKLVLSQIDGTWKARDQRMRVLRDRARRLVSRFDAHRLVHQDREESVRILGH